MRGKRRGPRPAPEREHCNRFGYCFTCLPGGVIPDLKLKCKFKWSQFCDGAHVVMVRHGVTTIRYNDGHVERETERERLGTPGPCERP